MISAVTANITWHVPVAVLHLEDYTALIRMTSSMRTLPSVYSLKTDGMKKPTKHLRSGDSVIRWIYNLEAVLYKAALFLRYGHKLRKSAFYGIFIDNYWYKGELL